MYVLMYDTATGRITGSYQLPDGSALGVGQIEGLPDQCANLANYRVDINADPVAVVALDAATVLANTRARLSAAIDSKVAGIYATWMRFQAEYEAREAAAQAYKDAGYTGDVSKWISGFSDAADKTPQEAADLILQQSVSLRGALEALGALRMRKYEVLYAVDLPTMQAAYDDIVAKVDATAATIH